jgi:shikimate kinase
MNVVLIGFMGTGKSAIGRSLAWHLEANFLDSDTEIEHVADKTIARLSVARNNTFKAPDFSVSP